MTSTSNKKKFLLGIVAILFLSSMVSGYYYSDSDITADTGFEIPQYDSQEEILTQLVAPFLFLTIILQIGLKRALMFTLDEKRESWIPASNGYKAEKKRIRKQSTFMALVIAAMLIPTPFWTYIRYAATSIGLIAVTIVLIGALYILKAVLS